MTRCSDSPGPPWPGPIEARPRGRSCGGFRSSPGPPWPGPIEARTTNRPSTGARLSGPSAARPHCNSPLWYRWRGVRVDPGAGFRGHGSGRGCCLWSWPSARFRLGARPARHARGVGGEVGDGRAVARPPAKDQRRALPRDRSTPQRLALPALGHGGRWGVRLGRSRPPGVGAAPTARPDDSVGQGGGHLGPGGAGPFFADAAPGGARRGADGAGLRAVVPRAPPPPAAAEPRRPGPPTGGRAGAGRLHPGPAKS